MDTTSVKLVVKSRSLELIELTISCYGVKGSSQETLKVGKNSDD